MDKFALLTCAVLAFLSPVHARKSYLVKEGIVDGRINVHQPRVRAFDCSWCFFKDTNNELCVSADANWKLEQKTSQENQEDWQIDVPPHFKQTFDYQTTQDGTWYTNFMLKKVL